MTREGICRRRFLGGSAAALFVHRSVLGGAGYRSPNDKLNLACVGVGGRAEAHVLAAAEENLVAVCDVDKKRLGAASRNYPRAKAYTDYRKMFEEVEKEIDAAFVATPDHHHAFATMELLRRGKHVYCEKPLTHSVWEARQITEAARRAKVATQMGNQGFSKEGTRLLAEWVAAGAIGNVTEVHLWTDRPIWAQGIEERPPSKPAPPHLEWDLWIGPAPYRDYHDLLHPFAWRGWWDFGCGALGDMGCHGMAPVFFALKLGYPNAVEAETSGVLPESAPLWSVVRYEFPARGDMPPVRLTWYDGKKKPPRPEDLEEGRQLPENGTLLVGDRGKILVVDESPRLIPEAKMREFKRPPKTLPRIPAGNHHQDWFLACRGERPACSNFDFAGPLTEAVLAGNVAIRAGRRLEWDGSGMKAKNAPEADRFVRREYRHGWNL